MNKNILYLDNASYLNPDLSPKAKTFFKIFYPVSIGIFFIVVFYLLVSEKKNFGSLPLLLYGILFCIFIINTDDQLNNH